MPPTYQQPSCPLDQGAIDKLSKFANDRSVLNPYKTQIKEALKGLAECIYDAQERLQDRQDALGKARKQGKRTGDEERLEAIIAELEEEVQDLTLQAEEMVRSCIDQQFAIEDDGKIISELYTAAHGEHQARRGADDGDDQASASLVNKLEDMREQKAKEWQSQSNARRYAKNNDYINFKRLWRDGAVGDNGPVLPNSDKWFTQDGEPVMEINRGSANNDDDSDDDVAVARETIDLRCPLSMLPLNEPYTNKHCNHTFEKQSIVEWLQETRAQKICPTSGCNQVRQPKLNSHVSLLTIYT